MNCDSIAALYRYFEYGRFGRKLEICRFALLPRLTGAQRALILGEGDGRFAARLAAHYPGIAADVFDTSRKMIRLAEQRLHSARLPHLSSIAFHHGDARVAPFPRNDYDLVATHFFFDVFPMAELSPLIDRVKRSLRPDGLWLISEFDLPSSGLRRLLARFWLRVMYLFFRYTTGLGNQRLPDWRKQLSHAGFRPRIQQSFASGFLVSELWEQIPCSERSIRHDAAFETR
jgi:ubiquinone/menaquinone biosynthesis C-methylase UbiE